MWTPGTFRSEMARFFGETFGFHNLSEIQKSYDPSTNAAVVSFTIHKVYLIQIFVSYSGVPDIWVSCKYEKVGFNNIIRPKVSTLEHLKAWLNLLHHTLHKFTDKVVKRTLAVGGSLEQDHWFDFFKALVAFNPNWRAPLGLKGAVSPFPTKVKMVPHPTFEGGYMEPLFWFYTVGRILIVGCVTQVGLCRLKLSLETYISGSDYKPHQFGWLCWQAEEIYSLHRIFTYKTPQIVCDVTMEYLRKLEA